MRDPADVAVTYVERRGSHVFGRDAKNKTIHTQRSAMSLNRNSPVRFQAIGSVERLHLTTPGVVKKNDQVIRNVPIPISDPRAESNGLNAPTPRRRAIVISTTPST